ncbi:MAG: sigma 54-interacting transcriptional regulator, partial [Nannocystaceae bacterium]|nr:sigma 54-interacting transcriptional regulator [Nannocystaceae bacterium]
LQEGEVRPVGGAKSLRVDVRLVCATHRDLPSMVRAGTFREDLWFRINVFPITVPPLRERTGDIEALCAYLVQHKCIELGIGEPPRLASGQLKALQRYPWPGNVREFSNMIERALILHRGGALEVLDVDASAGQVPLAEVLSLDEVQAAHIERVLTECGGRIAGPSGAAAQLKIKPSTLRSRMTKLGVRLQTAPTRE